jgi:hypothetical protein
VVYLLTFNCYGTHLPGSQSGWVERSRGFHRGGYQEPREGLESYAAGILLQEPFKMDKARADIVLDSIVSYSSARNWLIRAAHVRTTHIHLVVDLDREPDDAVRELKANASRAIRRLGLEAPDRRLWARGGSTRRLWNSSSVNAAVYYVIHGQGSPIALYSLEARSRASEES